MLSMLGAPTLAFHGGGAINAPTISHASSVQMAAIDDLKALATASNPAIGYWDPLNLASADFWDQGEDATIGFLRHAEIKHGRVAMAAFVGYCVQSLGIKFPYEPYLSATAATPPEQWDALPEVAKYQIVLFVGFLEVYSEHSFILEKQGEKHYMRGGKPGYFPKLDTLPHPVPFNLYDPANAFSEKMDEATKAKRLVMEINNGRLAMIGIMGFISSACVPGSVPGLNLPLYEGNVMIPFADPVFLNPGGLF